MPPEPSKVIKLQVEWLVAYLKWALVFAVWLVVGLPGISAAEPPTASDPSCVRRDTFELLPLGSAAEVATYVAIRRDLRRFWIRPDGPERLRFYHACDSMGLRKERVVQALQLLDMYIYRDTGQVELLAFAEDVANNLDVFPTDELAAAYNALGNVRAAVDDHARAIAYYLRSYEHCAPDATVDRVYALGNLGVSYAMAGDTARAIEAIGRSYEVSEQLTDSAELAYNRAYDCASLARLMVSPALADSAAYYLAMSRRNVNVYAPTDPRYAELLEEYQTAAIPYLIRQGHYGAARKHIDTLAGLSPDRASLQAAQLYVAEGQTRRAFEQLSARSYGDGRLEHERIGLLITLAEKLGDYPAGFRQLELRLTTSQLETKQMRDALTAVSEASVRSFDAQRAALAQRHANEVAVLKGRQRLYAAALIIGLSLAVAGYFYFRYRRSTVRVGNLKVLVSAHERDLERANAQLRERVRAMERYNHLLSHDLREPVRSISGFTSLLGRELKRKEVASENFEFLSKGVRQLEYLFSAVERLREVEDHTATLKPVRAVAVLRKPIDGIAAKYPHIKLKLDAPSQPLTLTTDADLLSIILEELVDNACKFSDAVGEVRVTWSCQEEDFLLTVADAGIGIEAQYREDYAGAGIGLALVQAATVKLEGALEVLDGTGSGGKGTTVTVRLPAAQLSPTPSESVEMVGAAA